VAWLTAASMASAEKNPENTGFVLSRSVLFEFGPKEQNSHIGYLEDTAISNWITMILRGRAYLVA
jgi:hypothetical protein